MGINRKKLPATLTNSRREEVPVEIIREEQLRKHLLVEDIFRRTIRFGGQMKKYKQQVMKKINTYEKWLLKQNGEEKGELNNITLTNYSGTMQVVVKSNKNIDFDENLQLAKIKIDECFRKWGKDSHPNIRAIIERYFRVDGKGELNKKAILGLFSFDITDRDWQAAMELIRKSIFETSRKEYLLFRFRETPEAAWETVNLNFSSIPAAPEKGKEN